MTPPEIRARELVNEIYILFYNDFNINLTIEQCKVVAIRDVNASLEYASFASNKLQNYYKELKSEIEKV